MTRSYSLLKIKFSCTKYHPVNSSMPTRSSQMKTAKRNDSFHWGFPNTQLNLLHKTSCFWFTYQKCLITTTTKNICTSKTNKEVKCQTVLMMEHNTSKNASMSFIKRSTEKMSNESLKNWKEYTSLNSTRKNSKKELISWWMSCLHLTMINKS